MRQVIDLNGLDADQRYRGWDRGPRGIAFDSDIVYVTSGEELSAYTRDFEPLDSWRNPYLADCQAIAVWERTLYVTSAGYDSILGFDLDQRRFHWAMNIQTANFRFKAMGFDPASDDGPLLLNKLHLNDVCCSSDGMYITGQRTGGMLHFNGTVINMAVELPPGSRDARPFRDGVLFNDTEAQALRYTGRGEGEEDRAMAVPTCDPADLQHIEDADKENCHPGFARGLCVLSDRVVAGGSSPSTVSVYDLAANEMLLSVNLSNDVRNAIHTIAKWPYD